MISNKKEINAQLNTSEFNLEILRNWCLLEDGVIKNSWYWSEEFGCKHKEYQYVEHDKNGNICMSYDMFEKGTGENYIQSLHVVPILASADTKKELLQLKRELGLTRPKKMKKQEIDDFISMLIKYSEKENKND